MAKTGSYPSHVGMSLTWQKRRRARRVVLAQEGARVLDPVGAGRLATVTAVPTPQDLHHMSQ